MLALTSAASLAQGSWPAKPVRIVVPFPPGGTTDVAARLLSEPLGRALGQPLIVENRAGANGNVGAAEVARSTTDGHIWLMAASGTLVINPFVYAKAAFDVGKDFVPVSLVLRSPLVILAHPSLGVKTLAELIALAKARPKKIAYGSPAIASTSHLAAELFAQRAGIELNHVPYKGSSPMIQDLLGGQVQLAFDTLASSIAHVQSGRLIALAVTSAKPVDQLVGVPPVSTTLPGFEAEGWIAMLAPSGTAKPVVERMAAEIDSIVHRPEIVEKFRQMGAEPAGGGAPFLQSFLASETAKWKDVVVRTGVKLD